MLLRVFLSYFLIHLCFIKTDPVEGFNPSSSTTLFKYTDIDVPISHKYRRGSTILQMSYQPFNPFTARSKNTRIRWFDTDLEAFYAFVESQPLLTVEQEFLYGRTIRMWSQIEHIRDQLKKRKMIGLLEDFNVTVSNDELADAVGCDLETIDKIVQYADVSKCKLVNSNLKLVLAVVSRYRSASIPNSELIAEGTRGLSKAALRYDYSKGFRFATYATWYVHQAVAEHVRWRKHPAKMPSKYLVLHRRVKQFTTEFRDNNNRFPTVIEIAESTNCTPFDVVKVLSMNTFPHMLHGTLKSNSHSYKGETNERTFEDVVPSDYSQPLDALEDQDLREDMEKMLCENLNDTERDILRLRLGLDDGREKPLKEVGKRFQLSWKKVRNLEKVAVTKLLSSKEIDNFVTSCNSASAAAASIA